MEKFKHSETDLLETHPFFQRLTIEQDKLLQESKKELERQNRISHGIYEEMVNNKLTYSTEMREMRKYQQRARHNLDKNVSKAAQSKVVYQTRISTDVENRRIFNLLQKCNYLNKEIVIEVVSRIDANRNDVRVR